MLYDGDSTLTDPSNSSFSKFLKPVFVCVFMCLCLCVCVFVCFCDCIC